jgi:hypothetical protein
MWQTKTFKTREAMEKWLKKREGRIQYTQIFINNGYGVEWRPLKIIKV